MKTVRSPEQLHTAMESLKHDEDITITTSVISDWEKKSPMRQHNKATVDRYKAEISALERVISILIERLDRRG